MGRLYRILIVCGLVLVAIGSRATAGEPLLILSGGGDPAANAINHWENVRWVAEGWRARGPVWALYADGRDPAPESAIADADPLRTLLADVVMGQETAVRFVDRRADYVYGAATRAELERWLAEVGARLEPGSFLNLYVTDHGTRATDPPESEIVLWHERLGAHDLAELLDRLPAGVGVRLIMSQCYGGGFTATVAELLARGRPACGFFATEATRVAAGCRYDPERSGYHEFTSFFFGSLLGRPRGAVAPPRASSYLEALVVALTELRTVDVPIWSGLLLDPQGAPAESVHRRLRVRLARWAAAPPPRAATASVTWGDVERARRRYEEAADALYDALVDVFPWLTHPFAPGFTRLLEHRRDRLAAWLAAAGARPYARWLRARTTYLATVAARTHVEVDAAARRRRTLVRDWLDGRLEGRALPEQQRAALHRCEVAAP